MSDLSASARAPEPSEIVWITATMAPAPGSGVASVELFYLPSPGSYARTPLPDDGRSGDGAAGDGVYGAQLPIKAHGGRVVRYYIGATSTNAFASASFEPALREDGPLALTYGFGGSGLRVTESMYSGPSGEFFELTNMTDDLLDLAGWSFDDDSSVPGTFSLSAAGIIEPGESIIVTETTPAAVAAALGLKGVTILGSHTAANLGRNDQINISNADGEFVERLSYGDEVFPGRIRTQNASGQVCFDAIGTDDITQWVLADAGDALASFTATTGEPGSPGSFVSVSCFARCFGDLDGDGAVGPSDLAALLGAWGACEV